jgi:hypothetical protein
MAGKRVLPNLVVSAKIEEKLTKKNPPVSVREVEQCFENRSGGVLTDTRERHKTNPPTLWFIAKTNSNRDLKIVYINDKGNIYLKSAFDPDAEEQRIYLKFGCK